MDLTKDKILNSDDLNPIKKHIPEWGGDVYIRILSAIERIKFEDEISKLPEDGNERIGIFLSYVLCDKSGNRLFDSKDAEKLMNKKASIVLDLYSTATKLNSLNIGELEKNL